MQGRTAANPKPARRLPPRKKTAKKTAKRNNVSTKAPRPNKPTSRTNASPQCLCGCRQETNYRELASGTKQHRLFLPGHDAKLKSAVMRGDNNLSTLSLRFIAGWHVLTKAQKGVVGADAGPSWRTLTSHGKAPKSWEEWYDLLR